MTSIGRISITTREGLAYLASIVCMAAFYFPAHAFVPSCFDDGFVFIELMGLPYLSVRYWISATTMYRGYSVPMFYSLFGEYNVWSSHAAIVCQALVAFLSWIVFAMTLASVMTGRRTRWLFFIVLASGMFSRGYLAYDDRFLSDSLALSMMLLWLSMIISPFPLIDSVRSRCGRSWLGVFLIVIYILTATVASARDTNILLMVCCTPLLLLRVPDRRLAALTAAAILFACGVEWLYSANRAYLPMGSVIAGVVLADQERTDYFAARGLPESVVSLRATLPATIKDRSLHQILADRQIVLRDMRGVRIIVLGRAADFARTRARGIYSSWLLTHPRYVLGNIIENWRVMFDQRYDGAFFAFEERGSLFELSKSLSIIDWLGIRVFIVTAATLCLIVIRRAGSDFLMRAGLILAIAGFANSVIAFHGDVAELHEMARHAWIGSTFLRLGLAVLCFRALSLLVTARSARTA